METVIPSIQAVSSLLSSLPWRETHKCVAAVQDPESTSSPFQALSLPRLIQGIISLCQDRLSKEGILRNVSCPRDRRMLSKPDSQSQCSWKQLASSAAITKAVVDLMPSRTDELPCISQVWAWGGQCVGKDQISCTFFLHYSFLQKEYTRFFLIFPFFNTSLKEINLKMFSQVGQVCQQMCDAEICHCTRVQIFTPIMILFVLLMKKEYSLTMHFRNLDKTWKVTLVRILEQAEGFVSNNTLLWVPLLPQIA